MSEYEDLCEKYGLSPGSEDDYDRLGEIMANGGGRQNPHSPNNFDDGLSVELVFRTFQEACQWSKKHEGKPFTRTVDGRYFAPVGSARANPATSNLAQISRSEVSAFLQGVAAPGSNWLPGTFVPLFGLEQDEERSDFDRLLENQYFLPRLSALAPRIARETISGRYSTSGLSKMMSSSFHQAQSSRQLQELLELLEGKLLRVKRWYMTQAIANGEEMKDVVNRLQEVPSPFQAMGKLWDHRRRYGKTPVDLLFWQGAVEVVREAFAYRTDSTGDECSADI